MLRCHRLGLRRSRIESRHRLAGLAKIHQLGNVGFDHVGGFVQEARQVLGQLPTPAGGVKIERVHMQPARVLHAHGRLQLARPAFQTPDFVVPQAKLHGKAAGQNGDARCRCGRGGWFRPG